MHNTMQIYVKKTILAVKAYGQSILHRKLRIILGAAVSLALFLLSSHYLFDGFHKRFIIYSALSLLTGAFIILPRFKRWYLSIPVVLLYLAYVPQKMFERIELPVHDLSELIEGSKLVNIMIIYLIFAFFSADITPGEPCLWSQRYSLACAYDSELLCEGISGIFYEFPGYIGNKYRRVRNKVL